MLLKKFLILFPFIVMLIFGINACESDPCFFPKEPGLYLQVYRKPDTLATLADLDTVWLGETNNGIKKRYVKGSFYLPLRQDRDSSSFKFLFKGATDTVILKLHYGRKTGLASAECGYVTFYENLAVNRNTFDSLVTVQNFIDTSYAVHIRTFLQR